MSSQGLGDINSKVLGISWNIKEDRFFYKTDTSCYAGKAMTRRDVLSSMVGMYDPLGFVNPTTIIGNLLFQETMRLGLGWDDVIPSSLQHRWDKWINSLDNIQLYRIPRCIKPQQFDDAYMELHHFADASKDAYGSCSFLRCTNKTGEVCTSLIMSKCRVAPIKVVTIPRLELQTAVLATKADGLLRSELELNINKSYFWIDSQIVLSYINNTSLRLQLYVANRISLIGSLSSPDQWFHIRGDLNPADLLKRGLQPEMVDMDKWLRGPSFLQRDKTEWPPKNMDTSLQPDDPEVKQEVSTACVTSDFVHPIDSLAEYSSS